jgi:predicted nucleic acid-binding protein
LPEVICNTSPLQYLHQLGALHVLPALVKTITVPPAVQEELNIGRNLGLNLPDLKSLDWVVVRQETAVLVVLLPAGLWLGESGADRHLGAGDVG